MGGLQPANLECGRVYNEQLLAITRKGESRGWRENPEDKRQMNSSQCVGMI